MDIFKFKKFSVAQDKTKMKIGTDGVLLGSWIPLSEDPERILDIGTGTGLIALMIAQRKHNALLDAVEIDEASFNQAKENFLNSPWSNRLKIYHSSIQEFSSSCIKKYDIIVSNPPFFSNSTPSKCSEKNLVKHTIQLSHPDLLKSVDNCLKENGFFSVILPEQEGRKFILEAAEFYLFPNKLTFIRPKKLKPISRLLIQFKKIKPKEIVLQNESNQRNDRTTEYADLTSEFYL